MVSILGDARGCARARCSTAEWSWVDMNKRVITVQPDKKLAAKEE